MKHDKPAPGLWTCFCCVLDVEQLGAEDPGWWPKPFFDTEAELLAYLSAIDPKGFDEDATDEQKRLAKTSAP